MSSRSKKVSEKTVGVAEVMARLMQLEEMVMRGLKTATVSDEGRKSVDMTNFMAVREKSPLLVALYPGREDGSRIYVPSDIELGPGCSGYWPSSRMWNGLYLGGTDGPFETRRKDTIPLCLGNNLSFFSPLGLGTNSADMAVRLEAMNSCACGVVDFSGEENSGMANNWLSGFELLYFFAQGFSHVHLVGFPTHAASSCMKFDEGDRLMNVCGPHLATTARKRRQDYYELLRVIVDAMEGWMEHGAVAGAGGLEQTAINFRANFVKPHLEGVRVAVLDRLTVVRSLGRFESDIGEAMRVIATMLVLGEMKTREFMELNVGKDWAYVRSEYANLQLRAEKASLSLGEMDTMDERGLHLQAFVDLVNMTDAALAGSRHLL